MSAVHALNGHLAPSHPAACPEPGIVKNPLTPKRRRRLVENDEYAAFVRRILRAYARRVAGGDVEAMLTMTEVAGEFGTLIQQAAQGLHTCGYTWADIGSRLGITRQAAQQRWGARP
jgi:hypothetical protein